jgi:hypothetical protein
MKGNMSIETFLESVELIRTKKSAVDESLSNALALLNTSSKDEMHKANPQAQQESHVSSSSASTLSPSAAPQRRGDDIVSLANART